MTRAEFTEEQPQYRYMKIDDEYADVFIYSFIEISEYQNMDADNQKIYVYDMNVFRCNQSDITEDMIKADPLSYLDYVQENEKSPEQQLKELEDRQNLTEQAVQDLILMTLGGQIMEEFLAYRILQGYLKLEDIPNEELRKNVEEILKEKEVK